jgi:hypothetical protein
MVLRTSSFTEAPEGRTRRLAQGNAQMVRLKRLEGENTHCDPEGRKEGR